MRSMHIHIDNQLMRSMHIHIDNQLMRSMHIHNTRISQCDQCIYISIISQCDQGIYISMNQLMSMHIHNARISQLHTISGNQCSARIKQLALSETYITSPFLHFVSEIALGRTTLHKCTSSNTITPIALDHDRFHLSTIL